MVHIYDVRSGSEDPLESFAPHSCPVAAMRYNASHDTVISIDQKGALCPQTAPCQAPSGSLARFSLQLGNENIAVVPACYSGCSTQQSRHVASEALMS